MTNLPASAAHNGKILIVDGAPAHLGVIVDSLEARGVRTLIAFDGIEALERAVSSQPDLILLDVKLQGINGFEICRRLKRDKRTRDIGVIFVSSLTDCEDRVKGFSAGCIDYVTEPFYVDEILARVAVHLEQSRRLGAETTKRKEAEATLSKQRDELERLVVSRTEALERANTILKTQIAARLQAREARFRTIVETSPAPLCITSMSGGSILYTNQPLRELFGMRKDVTANITDFYVDPMERDQLIHRLRTEGSLRNKEVRFRRPDGTQFWAMATARVATFDDYPAIYVGLSDITVHKQMEQELLEAGEQQREVSAYMEAIREQERKHIAMEIHDELGQLLTALKMDVSLLKMHLPEDSEASRKADDMRELVEGTIWMVRNVASHLRPAALDYGIASGLEWLVQDFKRRNSITCELSIDGADPTLSDARATAVFRILQVFLEHVARRANATRVEIKLRSSDSMIQLDVRDDSTGFDQHTPQSELSYWLLGMNERARLIGGSLTIESTPGAGTLLSIHVPVNDGLQS